MAGEPWRAMVVSDLDGTLLDSQSRLSDRNQAMLVALGAAGVLRVVATGRSLWSARRVLAASAPLDYLVFSSGAGVLQWRDQRLLRARDLAAEAALDAARVLEASGLDFMLHDATPHNHRFWYRVANDGNADFARRIRRYRGHCWVWPDDGPGAGPFSQLLAIEAPEAPPRLQTLREALAPLTVVRTTSPLDHASFWYEVFAAGVNKADGARWLAERHAIDERRVLAIGNDFNDEDLLEWAHEARVVANAPPALRRSFEVSPANDEDGFSVAVERWLGRLAPG